MKSSTTTAINRKPEAKKQNYQNSQIFTIKKQYAPDLTMSTNILEEEDRKKMLKELDQQYRRKNAELSKRIHFMMKYVKTNCQLHLNIDLLTESKLDVKAMGLVVEKVTQIDKLEVYGSKSGACGVDVAGLQKGYEQMMLTYLKKDSESQRAGATFQQKKKEREERAASRACNSKNGALTVFLFDGISQNLQKPASCLLVLHIVAMNIDTKSW